jgi:hypothetical protein
VLVGGLGAFWTNRLLAGELYGVTPSNPFVFGVVPRVLVASCWWPRGCPRVGLRVWTRP